MDGPLDRAIVQVQRQHLDILRKLFNTVYFVVKEEMPFTSFPQLIKLQKKNGSDLVRLESYATDQACRRFIPYIADEVREEVKQSLETANVFSVLYDGATDCSVSEVEIVYARTATRGIVEEKFIGLQDIKHANAQGVFDAIDEAFTERMTMPDWKTKLVGAGSDGAKVNIGRQNSVASRMQDEGRDYIIIMHCVAHRLELGIADGTKNCEELDILQDMLKKIYKHYYKSPKALRELRAVADALDEKFLKPTRLSGTRWIPHMSRAANILGDKYNIIYTHFDHVSQAGPGQATAEVRGRATFLAKKLRDWKVLRFLFHLQDVLSVVSTLSETLQKIKLTCVDFLDALERANLELLLLANEPGEKLQGFFAELVEDMGRYDFRGTELRNRRDLDYTDLKEIVQTVIQKVNGRLENAGDPTRPILSAARIFDTKVWPDTREDLALFGNDELLTLSGHFQEVLQRMGCQAQALPQEWTQAKAHLGNQIINQRQPRVDDRPAMASLYGHQDYRARFKNLLMLLDIVLALPVSSSTCERGFSAVKRIKSDWRSNLSTGMMNHLLMVSIQGKSTEEYVADIAIQRWWNRRRAPKFNDDQPEVEEQAGEDELLQFFMHLGMGD